MALLIFLMPDMFKYSQEEVSKLFYKQTDSSVRLTFGQIVIFQTMTASPM